jgi:poly(ADP-ribose) glycohydrolase ARH3
MIGDVIGAVVEGKPPAHIRATYPDVGAILAAETARELLGRPWIVGRYTDDTQMTISVAEWLVCDVTGGDPSDGRALLERFAAAYEPWRRYGPAVHAVMRRFPGAGDRWRELARAEFPEGSYGNGSAMRTAPVGLRFFRSPDELRRASRVAASTTHVHPLAICGALLQATAVAEAVRSTEDDPSSRVIAALREAVASEAGMSEAGRVYGSALDFIEKGLEEGTSVGEAAAKLGTGIEVHHAVPTALYCFLAHARDFERTVASAVYAGGDTDTIASMTGALGGALLGEEAIPASWLAAVREEEYDVPRMRRLADELFEAATG